MTKSKDKNKEKENELLENKKMRDELISRTEVLENVKALITLPNTEVLSSQLVAEYYEVTEDVIRDNIRRNREELESHGINTLEGESLREMKSLSGLKSRARSLTVFSKRAVLNMGMLLRDSRIAREVRNQLLNGFEKLSGEQKIHDINEEDILLLAVMKSTTPTEQAIAIAELNNYKNRHIAQLNVQLEEQKPKVNYYETVLQSTSLLTITQIAKDYGMTAVAFNKKLNKLKVQYKQSNQWLLYANHQDKGYTQSVTHTYGEDKSRMTTKWTQQGRLFLYELLKENDIKPLIETEFNFESNK